MDFITSLSNNYEKLRNKDMVNILWREILKEERSEEYLDQLIEYSFHYPVDSDGYLAELNEKFEELDKDKLRTIDGHLKAYMITFLYYCTNRYSTRVPALTTVLSSSLYIKLISIQEIGKIFFEKNMFKCQLFVCINVAKGNAVPDPILMELIRLLKKYCLQEKLDLYLLKATANAIVGVLMIKSKSMVEDIKNVDPLPAFCLNSLKEIILHEDDGNRLTAIIESLFRCLKHDLMESVPDRASALSNVMLFIRDVLQHELDEDKLQYMLDAFCNIWSHEDFTYYDEAVVIMNLFKAQYYKELLRKMALYSQSKNHRQYLMNIINLLLAIVKNLPPFPLDKVEVLYSCALRNVVFNIIGTNKKISNRAIEVIKLMCDMKDNAMLRIIFNQTETCGKFLNVSVEALLLSFTEIVDEKWGASVRNQNLLVIMAKLLAYTHNVNVELVQKTLQLITKDCTPFSLKPSLPILHELFCVMALKEETEIAKAVLKIMFKNAMHQDATSVEYSDHIFKSLLYPSVIDNVSYAPKYYYSIFLTSDFEFEALFIKCQKKIRNQHVTTVIENLNHEDSGGATLLCCLLKFCKYNESITLANFFIDNFTQSREEYSIPHSSLIMPAAESSKTSGLNSFRPPPTSPESTIATTEIMGPLSVGFQKILENKTITEHDVPQLDVLQSLIIEALYEQSFQVPCIKPAYDLLQKIKALLRIDQSGVLDQLLTIVSQKAVAKMLQNQLIVIPMGRIDSNHRAFVDNSIFMYLNELCLLLKKLPSDQVLRMLESYIDDPEKTRTLSSCSPEIYLQLVTLFTTVAMINKSKVPMALTHLRAILNDESQIVKVLGFKLLFTLCQEITHEYEEVIAFALKEIVNADPCLVRLCVTALEDLIYNDYIKLCSENFFRFIYPLGCDDLTIFMKEILMKRFVASNLNDIAKYYVQSVIYIHIYSKFPSYPISTQFDEDLVRMSLKLNNSKEIPAFLFSALPIRKKINILSEIATIFDDIIRGQYKVDDKFFGTLKDLIVTFKFVTTTNIDSPPEKQYYSEICKQIEKEIIDYDPLCRKECYYKEFENEITKCTITLLKMLFLENEQLAENIQTTLFDAIMHWIDFVKTEIVHYIHVERRKEHVHYFSKLVQYYKRNKTRFSHQET